MALNKLKTIFLLFSLFLSATVISFCTIYTNYRDRHTYLNPKKSFDGLFWDKERSAGPIPLRPNARNSSIISVRTFLLIAVISAPKNKVRRNNIRETWMNSLAERGKRFLVKFVVGTLNLSNKEKESLLVENKEHNDMLFLTDHIEKYENLTRKVLRLFVWVDQNAEFSYLLKTDDDVFVQPDVIESELLERSADSKPLYWGYFAKILTPQKKGRWKEEKWVVCDKYLPYALGGGYVLAAKLVHRIAVNADHFVLYNNEDVSVGAWLSPFELERKDDSRFDMSGRVKKICVNYLVMLSGDLKKRYDLVNSTGLPCEKKEQKH